MKRVAITQPYVPEYRVPLWEVTLELLRDADIEARIFYGNDPEDRAEIARRGDSASVQWAEEVPARNLRPPLLGRKLIHRTIPAGWREALLVTEMQATNGNAWAALAQLKPYITLGHGKAYTSGDNALGDGLEAVLNRRSRHALTYTEGGRASVLKRSRLSADRVTSFNNATDTQELRVALDAVSAAKGREFARAHGIPDDARVALFIGALNRHKRIDLLVEAARLVFSRDPRWWMIVAGEGPESSRVDDLATETGRVVRLGQASPQQFAPAARRATVLLNPGRIGLIAVDALCMDLPILTANASLHAPEAEYLTEGSDVFSSLPTAASFAERWNEMPFARPRHATRYIPSVEAAGLTISNTIRQVVTAIDKR